MTRSLSPARRNNPSLAAVADQPNRLARLVVVTGLLAGSAVLPGISRAQTGTSALDVIAGPELGQSVDSILDRLLADTAPRDETVSTATVSTPAEGRLDCVIRPSADLAIGAPEPGLLATVQVDRGDRVTAGQLLARLEDGVESATVALDRLRAESQVAILVRDAEAQVAARKADRARALRTRGVIPEDEADTAIGTEEVTRLAAELARQDRAQVTLELARSEAALNRRAIVSPVNGMVVEKLLSAGEYVDATRPILRIVSLDPLYVETFATADRFGQIHPGDLATVRPAPPLSGSYTARVELVDPVFDAAGGVFGVRLVLENPQGLLPAGYRCSVDFNS